MGTEIPTIQNEEMRAAQARLRANLPGYNNLPWELTFHVVGRYDKIDQRVPNLSLSNDIKNMRDELLRIHRAKLTEGLNALLEQLTVPSALTAHDLANQADRVVHASGPAVQPALVPQTPTSYAEY